MLLLLLFPHIVQVNEMHLLMAFNSPYVIRAYRCLTYRRLLAPERSESLLAGTRDSMDNNSMELDSFGGTPLNDQSSVAAAAAAAAAGAGSSGGGKRKSNSSFERSRSIGSSNAAVKPSRKSCDAAAAASEVVVASAPPSAGQSQQGTPSSSSIVGGLIKVRSSSGMHVTPPNSGGGGHCSRPSGSNQSSSVQMTPGGTNLLQTSRSSAGVGQGSRGSKNVHEGMNMLATWLVQVRRVVQGCCTGGVVVIMRADVDALLCICAWCGVACCCHHSSGAQQTRQSSNSKQSIPTPN